MRTICSRLGASSFPSLIAAAAGEGCPGGETAPVGKPGGKIGLLTQVLDVFVQLRQSWTIGK